MARHRSVKAESAAVVSMTNVIRYEHQIQPPVKMEKLMSTHGLIRLPSGAPPHMKAAGVHCVNKMIMQMMTDMRQSHVRLHRKA